MTKNLISISIDIPTSLSPASPQKIVGFTSTSSKKLFQAIILCMQFTGTLTNQTSEHGEKLNFGHDFGPFGQNLNFFVDFTSVSS